MNEDQNPQQTPPRDEEAGQSAKQGVTHNLDTGEDEPLTPPSTDDENMMDFASGSGGGSGGDGAAA